MKFPASVNLEFEVLWGKTGETPGIEIKYAELRHVTGNYTYTQNHFKSWV